MWLILFAGLYVCEQRDDEEHSALPLFVMSSGLLAVDPANVRSPRLRSGYRGECINV